MPSEQTTIERLIAFEDKVAALWLDGQLPFLFHQSGGNERQLIEVFRDIRAGDWIFSTHRSHYHYLLAGGKEADLLNMILDGRSMFVFDKRLNFLTSSVLGGCCGIAAGVALGLRMSHSDSWVHCFVGDGAADNGHLYEAVRFVESKHLPCRFILEDNGVSCGATRIQRGADANVLKAKCVVHYSYTMTQPHCQTRDKTQVTFKERA